MSYIIVAYYTENSDYAVEAERLRINLQYFELPHDIVAVPSQGSWQQNTQYKAFFLQEMMQKHYPKNLVYLDVDARVVRYPRIFDTLTGDLGLAYHNRWELLTGTMYLANNDCVQQLIDRWQFSNQMLPAFWDQEVLEWVINQSSDLNLRITKLPLAYCKIFDTIEHVTNPVIEHYQASRRLKNKPAIGTYDHENTTF